jgi:hypothetical protein
MGTAHLNQRSIMMKTTNKQDQLSKSIVEFKNSNQTGEDYMKLITTIQMVMRQGSGLCWDEVESIVNNSLK